MMAWTLITGTNDSELRSIIERASALKMDVQIDIDYDGKVIGNFGDCVSDLRQAQEDFENTEINLFLSTSNSKILVIVSDRKRLYGHTGMNFHEAEAKILDAHPWMIGVCNPSFTSTLRIQPLHKQ